jgi:hypothetical protein
MAQTIQKGRPVPPFLRLGVRARRMAGSIRVAEFAFEVDWTILQ